LQKLDNVVGDIHILKYCFAIESGAKTVGR